MRVFVSEYLTCGAWPEERIAGSLAVEGRAMVEAVIADFARAGARVVTTWDARLEEPHWDGLPVECLVVRTPREERERFGELAARADATFVVAPEFHDILLDRCRLVQAAGSRWPGCAAEAIALCADKLRLARHLQAHGVRTIETQPLDAQGVGCGKFKIAAVGALAAESNSNRRNSEFSTPDPALVIKPRDGAGSQLTFRVSNAEELARVRRLFSASNFRGRAIVQPYVPGRTVSVAAIVWPDGCVEVFPLAEQHLSDDGRFRYLGGRVRCPPSVPEQAAIEALLRAACAVVPGLAGYVGFDLILPDASPREPVLVEINPRLTTSYLGYRRLAGENLAERLLLRSPSAALDWRRADVRFTADGLGSLCPAPVVA